MSSHNGAPSPTETQFPTDQAFAEECLAAVASLFPCGSSVAVLTEPSRAGPLAPIERIGIERFMPQRLAEFQAGRDCARRALAAFGNSIAGVARAQDRSPVWPAGLSGSISHCSNLVAAVVARWTEARALGLDLEHWRSLPPDVEEMVLAPGERIGVTVAHAPTLVFSAKEALYKCQAPITGHFLDFNEVVLDLEEETECSGRFRARVLDPFHPTASHVAAIKGRWRIGSGWIATGALLPPSDQERKAILSDTIRAKHGISYSRCDTGGEGGTTYGRISGTVNQQSSQSISPWKARPQRL